MSELPLKHSINLRGIFHGILAIFHGEYEARTPAMHTLARYWSRNRQLSTHTKKLLLLLLLRR